MAAATLLFLTFAVLARSSVANAAPAEAFPVRGPPIADSKEVVRVGRVGENLRLVCPVSGFPQPMVEWFKDGEKIDFMWDRFNAGRKHLKIKNLNEDDTGVFVCKGINGFGSESVRIELIVVDPHRLPASLQDGDVAPPVFTYETRAAPTHHVKSVGDSFKVSCEALGSPQPEIFWFKDGQHINDDVHFRNGKSSVEFSVMGGADSGTYTCRASNLLGERTHNFTLEVRPGSSTHAIVTEAGPANTTVQEGETATLQCRVKSLAPPHIKWLKKLDDDETRLAATAEMDSPLTQHALSVANTITVGQERYRILGSSQDVLTGNDEYLNRLELANVKMADGGMYICFVTNSGFGALTYKSMNLRVVPKSITRHVPSSGDAYEEPLPVLVIVICMSVVVLILIIVITVCVIRKRSMSSSASSTSSISSAKRPLPSPEETSAKGLLLFDHQQQQHQQHLMLKQQHLLYPLPATHQPYISGRVYPAMSDPTVACRVASNWNVCNQYEVPYAHLLQPSSASSGSHFRRQSPTGQSSSASACAFNEFVERGHVIPPEAASRRYPTDCDSH